MSRNIFSIVSVLVLAGLTLGFAAACTTTQSAGGQANDDWIHAKVKGVLTGAKFSNMLNVDVDVTNGVVTLAGQVANREIRSEAIAEARGVEGVKRVVDSLQVEDPPRY